MDILRNFSEILKTKTISHSLVTIIGTGINGVLGVLFFVFLARFLGPENFGLVSISIIFLNLIADIADFGVNTGLINFIGRHAKDKPLEALRFLKLGLIFKLTVYLAVAVIGITLAPLIAEIVFLKPELTQYLRLSFIGVGAAMLFSFSTNSLQAYQKYWSWSVLNITSNAFRLLAVFILIGGISLNSFNALIIYITFPFLGFFISLFLLPKNFLFIKNEKSVFKEFFHYNKWVALSILVAAISSRIDSFFVARLLTIDQNGIYSVGTQLSSIMPQFIFAIAAVVAPKIGSYTSHKELLNYLKKLQLLVLGLAILGFLLSPLAFVLIPLIYGMEYISAIIPLLILFYAQLIFLVALPSHQTIFYYFSNPKIFVVISILIMFVLLILNLILIPTYGIIGAALSVLVGSIINFILPTIYVYNSLAKFQNSKIHGSS